LQTREIASSLAALLGGRRMILVAIDGPGGSGKSALARSLRMTLDEADVSVSVVEVDDFYLPSAARSREGPSEKPIGGDFDWRRLRDQVLEPLRRGQSARYDRYDWAKDELSDMGEVLPGGVVLVEGIYSNRRELTGFYDLRIWVECPRELRLTRGLERDGETARSRWEQDWMPSEDRYIQEHRPQDLADIVVRGDAA
jgi:uridine kinase